ncbi:hypothetical protein LE190_05550 [Massilia oculi]|uniref:Alpha-L-glutamate ligase-related protein ATP-grasp domain-containing protein n=1 Tax=Massilia hydrophila TaxID=3044279 RepID=A0ABS7Y6U6_9BURK|nr:sugar-transfer associated ATP-grasp domain-containing protein [Massilia oculi]MCA1855389.1 hypothetical protein [Massilia oculi]
MMRRFELAQLRRPPNRLTADEYAMYGLAGRSWAEKAEFLGVQSGTAVNSNNEVESVALTRDKLVTYGILSLHGFPFPAIRAVGHVARGFPGAASLPSVQAVETYLEQEAQFPLFMKPIAGNGGAGSVWVSGYADGMLRLRDGRSIAVADYFKRWLSREGILLQAAARPHPEIARRIGPRLSTARVVVLVTERGPIVHRAVLRIPAGNNMIDNFRHGATGNLLGAFEVDSGEVFNAIGMRQGRPEPVAAHPDTGEALVGWTVPDWQQAKEICLRAAPLFPGIRYQSWDIAFTEEGPQTMEVNSGGDVDVLQLASGRGIADATWWALLREPAPRSLLRRWYMRSGPWARHS